MKNSENKNIISFSILMANYNNSTYIQEAIESVLNQTYSNWELVIVDDCSTDNSIEKIKFYLIDKRIKLIALKRQFGVGFAKKTACENATNQILGILDADDKLYNEALEILAKVYQENPDIGFVYTNMWNCDSNLKNCKINKLVRFIPDKKSIFYPYIFHFKTFRKDAYKKIKGYDPNLRSAVDKDIIYQLEEVIKFKFINIPLYYYRHHEAGVSQGKREFQARINLYIAKCKVYRRRLNINLPNYSLKSLYIEYFKITLNNLIRFIKKLFKTLKINIIFNSFSKIFPNVSRLIKRQIDVIRYASNSEFY